MPNFLFDNVDAKLSVFTMLVQNCPFYYFGAKLSVCLLDAKLSVFTILEPTRKKSITQGWIRWMIINLRVRNIENHCSILHIVKGIKPPYYRIMDNVTLNGELEHTLVLSLVEEIEVAAAIIIVFLVRYFAIWDGFLLIYVSEPSFLFNVDYEILETYCNFQVNLPLLFFLTYQSRLTFIDYLVREWSLYTWITWPVSRPDTCHFFSISFWAKSFPTWKRINCGKNFATKQCE